MQDDVDGCRHAHRHRDRNRNRNNSHWMTQQGWRRSHDVYKDWKRWVGNIHNMISYDKNMNIGKKSRMQWQQQQQRAQQLMRCCCYHRHNNLSCNKICRPPPHLHLHLHPHPHPHPLCLLNAVPLYAPHPHPHPHPPPLLSNYVLVVVASHIVLQHARKRIGNSINSCARYQTVDQQHHDRTIIMASAIIISDADGDQCSCVQWQLHVSHDNGRKPNSGRYEMTTAVIVLHFACNKCSNVACSCELHSMRWINDVPITHAIIQFN